MSRIRGPYVRFCERDEAVTPHPTQFGAVDSAASTKLNGARKQEKTAPIR